MSDAAPGEQLTFWQKFRANLDFVWRKAQTWAVTFWGAVEMLWQAVDSDVKTQMVQGVMSPKWVGFGIAGLGIVSYFAAHGWPQPKLAAKLAAKAATMPEAVKNMPMPGNAAVTDHAALDTLPKVTP